MTAFVKDKLPPLPHRRRIDRKPLCRRIVSGQ